MTDEKANDEFETAVTRIAKAAATFREAAGVNDDSRTAEFMSDGPGELPRPTHPGVACLRIALSLWHTTRQEQPPAGPDPRELMSRLFASGAVLPTTGVRVGPPPGGDKPVMLLERPGFEPLRGFVFDDGHTDTHFRVGFNIVTPENLFGVEAMWPKTHVKPATPPDLFPPAREAPAPGDEGDPTASG